jgi:hypothetical protein
LRVFLACSSRALRLASRGFGGGSAGAGRADPVALDLSSHLEAALAEIVGEGRPWTVVMISLLSMPCR